MNFGNPTSAPLIVLVVTITPLPLLYHVRAFYIAHYTSPTTYLSNPTYTFNELQTKEKEKETKEKRKNGGKIEIIKIIIMIIMIIIIIILKSATNLHIHHFKTTFVCPSSIESAVRFCQALPGFPITAHHLCAFLM